jgi:hypothetical protein
MAMDSTRKNIHRYLITFSLTNLTGIVLLVLGYTALSGVFIIASGVIVVFTLIRLRSLKTGKPKE